MSCFAGLSGHGLPVGVIANQMLHKNVKLRVSPHPPFHVFLSSPRAVFLSGPPGPVSKWRLLWLLLSCPRVLWLPPLLCSLYYTGSVSVAVSQRSLQTFCSPCLCTSVHPCPFRQAPSQSAHWLRTHDSIALSLPSTGIMSKCKHTSSQITF